MRGAFSELRLWKRCLPDEELAMELNSIAPPDDLVRCSDAHSAQIPWRSVPIPH